MSANLLAGGDVGALVLEVGHESLHRNQIFSLSLVVHDVGYVFGGNTLTPCMGQEVARDRNGIENQNP